MCDFSLNPHPESDYPPHHGLKSTWDCSREAVDSYDDKSFCIFHLPVEVKSDSKVREEFLKLVESRKKQKIELLGARFSHLDLSHLVIDGGNNNIIDMRYSEFEQGLNLNRSTIHHPLYLDYCDLRGDELNANGAEFKYEFRLSYSAVESINCSSVLFQRNVNFRGTHISQGISVSNSRFEGKASFYGVDFISEWKDFLEDSQHFGTPILIDFSEVEFIKDANFNSSQFNYPAEFRDISVGGSLHFESTQFNTIRAEVEKEKKNIHNGADINKDILSEFGSIHGKSVASLSGNINDLKIAPDSGSGIILIGGPNTVINSGEIPLSRITGFVLFFYNCRIGEINFRDLRSLETESLVDFSKLHFKNVTFDGFRFGDYVDELENINFELNDTYGVGLLDGWEGGSIEFYRSARRSASAQGESDIASRFYIKEMNAKEDEIRRSISRSDDTLTEQIFDILSSIRLMTFRLTSGYGEKPWKVIVTSAITIASSSIFYPLIGGAYETDGTTYNLSNVLSGDVSVGETILNSLYFSLVTFSTVGYGDLKPHGIFSKLVASGEALIGALLLALLVFTLGQRTAR